MLLSGTITKELEAIKVVASILTFPVPPVGDIDIPFPAVICVTPPPPPPVAALKTKVFVAAEVIVILIPLKFIKLPVLAENCVVLFILTIFYTQNFYVKNDNTKFKNDIIIIKSNIIFIINISSLFIN
jgi:hypothetical protein